MPQALTTHDKGRGWVVAQITLMLACLVSGWLTPWRWQGVSWDWCIALGLTLASAWFGIAGVIVLGGNRTIYPEPREGGALVRHGVYRHVRHPLYSSVMLLAFGWAIWFHSLLALGLAVLMAVFLTFKASSEERRLVRRFPDYSSYQGTTKRFIPWLF